MRIDILTLFPEMCERVLDESIIGRARKSGIIEVECTGIRPFTTNKHGKVDDYPYGGGMGMVMSPQPIYDCFSSVCQKLGYRPKLIYVSPKGAKFTQKKAIELRNTDGFAILCGHYEGVDQRIIDEIVDEEISVGDFVLTGGELPALMIADAVCRLVPGVLSDEECFTEESHFGGLLEYPQYTRPPEWHGRGIPEVLMSGHHKNIAAWRREQSILETAKKRPDMLEHADLTEKERHLVAKLTGGE